MKTTYDDRQALLNLVHRILGAFRQTIDPTTGNAAFRLAVSLPIPPGNDLFEKMSAKQQSDFHGKLEALAEALRSAGDDPDPHSAGKTLEAVFGDAFPVPDEEDQAKRRGPAIVSSGDAA